MEKDFETGDNTQEASEAKEPQMKELSGEAQEPASEQLEKSPKVISEEEEKNLERNQEQNEASLEKERTDVVEDQEIPKEEEEAYQKPEEPIPESPDEEIRAEVKVDQTIPEEETKNEAPDPEELNIEVSEENIHGSILEKIDLKESQEKPVVFEDPSSQPPAPSDPKENQKDSPEPIQEEQPKPPVVFSQPPPRKEAILDSGEFCLDRPEEEESAVLAHKRNVFAFTHAGKLFYTYHGDEDNMSGFIASLSVVVAKIALYDPDETSQTPVRSIKTGGTLSVFLTRKEISLVVISKDPQDNVDNLTTLLEYLSLQIIATLTNQVNLRLKKSGNYDPKQHLGGTTSPLTWVMKATLSSPCFFLNSYMVMPLPYSKRSSINDVLKKHNDSSILYSSFSFSLLEFKQLQNALYSDKCCHYELLRPSFNRLPGHSFDFLSHQLLKELPACIELGSPLSPEYFSCPFFSSILSISLNLDCLGCFLMTTAFFIGK